ncbi:OsmC family protein [Pseudonocardia abyssalis]|uniref:OsmC family protein n=1 Tax=Pseudonocardia abyssalis TaxID=2792008 RepID=A0ABS6UMK3_9PSEU|nr:OsmC family protein [Pseudonocardia abyssalis]MBW0114888.1 OsmC family protein [Pseudonocardia abyssalis]MBW0133478.1 OsmC family protein [Pseudonocardia abyssalis]
MSVDTPAPAIGRDQTLSAILDATGSALADDPDRAAALFRATGTGGDGVRAEIRIGRHSVLVDEPPALGGADDAPNPVENALAGLLSCQVVTYRFWAVKLGIPLDDIAVDVEGDLDVRGFFGLDDAVRPGFGEVRVKVTLSGPAEPERYRELAAAVDAHCPVLDLFRNTTPVTTELVTV